MLLWPPLDRILDWILDWIIFSIVCLCLVDLEFSKVPSRESSFSRLSSWSRVVPVLLWPPLDWILDLILSLIFPSLVVLGWLISSCSRPDLENRVSLYYLVDLELFQCSCGHHLAGSLV